jgi:1-acyl-sn-glycerol-3-phosphate acyltransferase
MIVAAKRPWFSAWLARHAERRSRATFDSVVVAGARAVAQLARSRPILVVCNHSSWWDAMMVLVLSERVLRVDGHALMDAANLRRLRFFALCGGIGVDLHDPRDGARAIRHCARLLDRPGRVLWMFPQGAERPLHEPLQFHPGSGHIARLAPAAAVIPLALVYGFGAVQKPRAFAAFGPPIELATDVDAVIAQRDGVARQLARVRAHQSGSEPAAFEPVLAARRSHIGAWASTALDRIAGRLLEQPTRAEPQIALTPAHTPGPERAYERREQE